MASNYITFVRGGLRELWYTRKPTIAVFGPSVANEGYCCSSFVGSTHNSETDSPLPPYDSTKHGENPGRPDTQERIAALQKLARERLQPGDLALVKVEDRHGNGFYGYIVLPGKKLVELDPFFSMTRFEYMAPMPIVPHDLVTPLLKEAILEMMEECEYNVSGRGLGFASRVNIDMVKVNLGAYAWLHVPLRKDDTMPPMIDYEDCSGGSWWDEEGNSTV
jgi:hypothetical protein